MPCRTQVSRVVCCSSTSALSPLLLWVLLLLFVVGAAAGHSNGGSSATTIDETIDKKEKSIHSSSSYASLQRLMVVHRHGARTALLMCENSTLTAPLGPGVLITAGKIMLFQLGQYIKEHFPSAISKEYNERKMYTRSADVGRCIQSAESLLCGLYGQDWDSGCPSHLLPAIRTMNKTQDLWLDSWGGMANLGLRYAAQEPLKYDYMNAAVQSLWSNATMRKLSADVGFGSECPEQPYNCLGDAADFAAYALAAGTLEKQYPVLNALHNDSMELWWKGNNYTYNGPFRTTGDFQEHVGEQGYPLARELIRNARGWTEEKHVQHPSFVHYSGHDVTLMPLTKALGNDTVMDPPFGAALLVEVFTRNLTGSELWVSARYGYPVQSPLASNNTAEQHKYENFEIFSMWCIDTTGKVYPSDLLTPTDPWGAGCPLDDWERYIATRGPSERVEEQYGPMEQYCYAVPSDLEATHCEPESSHPSHVCLQYRSQCPLTGCGSNGKYLMNRSLFCSLSMDANGSQSQYSLVEMVLIPIGSALAAFLLGLWCGFKKGKGKESSSYEAIHSSVNE